MFAHTLTKRSVALGVSLCLGLGTISPSVAIACEGAGEEAAASLTWNPSSLTFTAIGAAGKMTATIENESVANKYTVNNIALKAVTPGGPWFKPNAAETTTCEKQYEIKPKAGYTCSLGIEYLMKGTGEVKEELVMTLTNGKKFALELKGK